MNESDPHVTIDDDGQVVDDHRGHTVGRWRIENLHGVAENYGRFNAVSADPVDAGSDVPRQRIAEVSGLGRAETLANARLIAAAPAMLAALQRLAHVAGGWVEHNPRKLANIPPAIEQARAAISAATA